MSFLMFRDPFEHSSYPSRILDHYFDLSLEPEDILSPLIARELRQMVRCSTDYLKIRNSMTSKNDAESVVSVDQNKFQANLDVQQFKPDEITVKVSENIISVEGKHEEKEDEHGFISRHFVRKYILPKGYDISKIESKLSSDGVLIITAPKIDIIEEGSRSIPIIQTGQPSKSIGQKLQNKVEDAN